MPTSIGHAQSNILLGKLDILNDPQDAAQAVRVLWDQRGLKDELEARAARNSAFYDGRQLWEWSRKTRRMELPEKYRQQRDLLIYNIIKPLISQKLSKLARNDPVWNVPSYTSDEWDQMVARFSNDLLGWYYKYGLRVPTILDRYLRLVFCSPVAWLEPAWDPVAGEAMPPITMDDFFRDIPEGASQEIGDEMRGEDRELFQALRGFDADTKQVTQYTGDIALYVRSIWNVMWEPFFVNTWDEVNAYLVSEVMAPETVAHRYRLPIDEVMKFAGSSEADEHYAKVLGCWTSPIVETPLPSIDNENGIIVHQLHVHPRVTGTPNGASAIVLGHSERALRQGPLGNPMNKLPLIPTVEHPSNAFAWGTCSIDDAIPAQVDLNDNRTQLGRWRRKKVKPKLAKKKTDGGDIESLESDDGVYELANLADTPKAIWLPGAGQEEMEGADFNLKYMHDALAVPNVSLGNTRDAGDRSSGRKVIALQEEANIRTISIGKSIGETLSLVGELFLAMLQKYATAERLTPIVGENNAVEFKAWSSASLQPTIYKDYPTQAANVVVNTFSNIPTTNAEMRQMVLMLLETGALRPGEHDRLIIQVFGLEDFRAVLDQGRSGRAKAESKVTRWRMGEFVPPPNATDDHVEAVGVITDFVNGEEFATILATQPAIAQQVLQHLEEHEQAKYDVEANDVMRRDFAMMRAAALYAQKAAESGLEGATMRFMAMANGLGLPMPGEEGSPKKQSTGREREEEENDKRQQNRNQGGSPKQARRRQTESTAAEDKDRARSATR